MRKDNFFWFSIFASDFCELIQKIKIIVMDLGSEPLDEVSDHENYFEIFINARVKLALG